MSSAAALWALLAALAYILPVDRVVMQLAREHESAPALRIEASLEGIGDGWPGSVSFELHREFGLRVEGDHGNRWLFLADGGVQGTRLPAPPWIPDLRLLALEDEEQLWQLVAATGLDPGVSELARCGELDCFVLGGRRARAQLWVEKDRFEILEASDRRGRRTRYADYRTWDRVRFPAEIEVFDSYGSVATLHIDSVARVRLREEHFSPSWLGAAAPE